MKQSIQKQNKNQKHLARKLPRNQTKKQIKDFVGVWQIYFIFYGIVESQLS
jgi:hypothetical protein